MDLAIQFLEIRLKQTLTLIESNREWIRDIVDNDPENEYGLKIYKDQLSLHIKERVSLRKAIKELKRKNK